MSVWLMARRPAGYLVIARQAILQVFAGAVIPHAQLLAPRHKLVVAGTHYVLAQRGSGKLLRRLRLCGCTRSGSPGAGSARSGSSARSGRRCVFDDHRKCWSKGRIGGRDRRLRSGRGSSAGSREAALLRGERGGCEHDEQCQQSGNHSFFRARLRYFPVHDPSLRATCSGVPSATTRPPPSPPSGPRSITQSAHFITSRLCSISAMVFPCSTSLSQHLHELFHVGEMKARGRLIQDVECPARAPAGELQGELHPLRLPAGKGQRRLAQAHVPQADVVSVASFGAIVGMWRKNSSASSTVISRTSWMFLPL